MEFFLDFVIGHCHCSSWKNGDFGFIESGAVSSSSLVWVDFLRMDWIQERTALSFSISFSLPPPPHPPPPFSLSFSLCLQKEKDSKLCPGQCVLCSEGSNWTVMIILGNGNEWFFVVILVFLAQGMRMN